MGELMRDHFYYEEAEVCDSLDLPWDYCKEHKAKHVKFSERLAKMRAPVDFGEIKWAQDWLAQHIKNTDFGYKGHLKHEVPEPYVWDESFATDYTRIDEEHDVLFANILAVSQHPDDAAKLQVLKDNMDLHFQYEEQRFSAIPNFACVAHKMKHYRFLVVLEDQQVPVGCEEINWARTGSPSTSRTRTTSTGRGWTDLTPERTSLVLSPEHSNFLPTRLNRNTTT